MNPSFSHCFLLFPVFSPIFPLFPLIPLLSLFHWLIFSPSFFRGWFFPPLPSSANWPEYIPLIHQLISSSTYQFIHQFSTPPVPIGPKALSLRSSSTSRACDVMMPRVRLTSAGGISVFMRPVNMSFQCARRNSGCIFSASPEEIYSVNQ